MKETIFAHSLIFDLDSSHLAQFEEYVNKDVKNTALEEDVLILKSNLELWLYSLSSIRRNVEYHLSSRTATKRVKLASMIGLNATVQEIESYKNSESEWRVNAIKFLSTIEKKTLYVKMLCKEQNQISKIVY